MKKNMSSLDRWIRLVLAAVVVALYLTGQISGLFMTALLVLAVVFTLTSAVGICPLYSLFGLSTCAARDHGR